MEENVSGYAEYDTVSKDKYLIHRLVFPQVLAVCTVIGVIIIGKV